MNNAIRLPDLATMGDTIVGSYDPITGALKKEGFVVGDQEFMNQAVADMERSFRIAGAEKNGRIAIKKEGKGKKKKEPRSKYNKPARYTSEEEPQDIHEDVQAQLADEELEEFVVNYQPLEQEIIEPKQTKKKIQFFNAFGKISMKVLNVLENPMAFALIFANEDDMIFIPKPGETLTFTDPDQNEHLVYFPDVLFTLPDGVKRIMIIFKTALNEDEPTD